MIAPKLLRTHTEKRTVLGAVVIVFVLLAGAIGYYSVLNSSARMASDGMTVEVPEVKQKKDLDAATQAIDSVSLDDELRELDAAADF